MHAFLEGSGSDNLAEIELPEVTTDISQSHPGINQKALPANIEDNSTKSDNTLQRKNAKTPNFLNIKLQSNEMQVNSHFVSQMKRTSGFSSFQQ